jgi:hypothetical protein
LFALKKFNLLLLQYHQDEDYFFEAVLSGRLEKTRKAHAKNLFGQRKNRGWKAFDFELKGATLFYTRSDKGDNVPQKIDLSRASSIVYLDGDKESPAPEIQVVLPEVRIQNFNSLCHKAETVLLTTVCPSTLRRMAGPCIFACLLTLRRRLFRRVPLFPSKQPTRLRQPQKRHWSAFRVAHNFTTG